MRTPCTPHVIQLKPEERHGIRGRGIDQDGFDTGEGVYPEAFAPACVIRGREEGGTEGVGMHQGGGRACLHCCRRLNIALECSGAIPAP